MIRLIPAELMQAVTAPSPLTGSPSTPVHGISCEDLIQVYAQHLQVNIRPYLGDLQEIQLRRCPESGFRFYFPQKVVGDDAFYRALAVHGWYYQEEKWEFAEALRFLPSRGKILEVGPGKGGFMRTCLTIRPALKVTGLELNQEAVEAAKNLGLDVRQETLERHAEAHGESYDAVCAFQVLEHIPEPLSFLRDCLRVLKPGGLLMVAVPDSTARQTAFSLGRAGRSPQYASTPSRSLGCTFLSVSLKNPSAALVSPRVGKSGERGADRQLLKICSHWPEEPLWRNSWQIVAHTRPPLFARMSSILGTFSARPLPFCSLSARGGRKGMTL